MNTGYPSSAESHVTDRAAHRSDGYEVPKLIELAPISRAVRS